MKNRRHDLIKKIIEEDVIETQEALAEALRARHVRVTQATISRDIKELFLIKVPAGGGRYRYAVSPPEHVQLSETRMKRLFKDNVVHCDFSENIVLVKTVPGGANTVASALDATDWKEMLGTVAGDDTIFVLVKPKEAVEIVAERIHELLR
ncbi:arginine repressor [Selenomonas artemidis]|jgi:arginine repressor|uniref:Arginine repressor n=1 Tax=Selenomonas artemidis F0399 TaxID=749551 RepID=E7MZW9_9FIRM|nr:arginine repressor [Selenomonas artemidis]EFW30633.1 arginine repressor [Selenomonas artemidis F0399]